MDPELVSILDGNHFVLSDDVGDIYPCERAPAGVFSFDTRFVSCWRLTLNGKRLHSLSVDDLNHFETRYFLVPGAATHYVDAKLSVIRHRWVGASFDETITVLNHDTEPADVRIRIDVSADFADTAQLRLGYRSERPGRIHTRVEQECLRLSYERETFVRETIVSAREPHDTDAGGMTFTVRIPPHGRWSTGIHVHCVLLSSLGRDIRSTLAAHKGRQRVEMRAELADWMNSAPRLATDSRDLSTSYQRSLVDLGALRYPALSLRPRVPVGGMPWHMTLCGRDAIVTCLQTICFTPQLTPSTLLLLASGHGVESNDFREEEPGKILDEVRYGESAAFEDLPHAAYYGAADTTPLFVVLLDEYQRWTGDVELVRELEYESRAALRWIDEYGDLTGRGYLSYRRRNTEHGLENQGWKNSWDAVSYADGRLPGLPRSTCELQGYAYDAKLRGARLARLCWGDPAYADRLEREATELKVRFNRDFWLPREEYFAAALDGDGTPVDSLTSNIGHLLWSGIVDEDKADKVAGHLTGDRLFSGWGIRTLADDSRRYNPLGTHTGMIWPFDNSLTVWGLRRYGFDEQAVRVAEGLFDAAAFFNGRLPAAFAGYDRALTKNPVRRPGVDAPYSPPAVRRCCCCASCSASSRAATG
ncbi:glycogen debranching N-terminal domain-containing protein [Micromonospora zhanjiangensis]